MAETSDACINAHKPSPDDSFISLFRPKPKNNQNRHFGNDRAYMKVSMNELTENGRSHAHNIIWL